MTPEQPPRKEFSEKERAVIALLREKGPEDAEARAAFIEWCEEAEAEATKENTSRANIEVQLRRAKVYWAAGGYDSALDALEAVREAASNDPSARDLYDEAMTLIDEIGAEQEKS